MLIIDSLCELAEAGDELIQVIKCAFFAGINSFQHCPPMGLVFFPDRPQSQKEG